MTLPEISSYKESELNEASQFSLALAASLARTSSQDSLVALRNTTWSRAVLASYFDRTPAKEVCKAWSQTADQVLAAAIKELKAPPGLALFAVGKLGSMELNLSSDVDLIFVCESESEEHIKFLRKFQKRISEPNENGFLFRVDFDLRPGGKLGPLVPTLDQFIDFYGNYGETWERLAFIRLRPVFGDSKIQEEVMSFVKKFVFRKHLDFSLLDDLKILRAKVHQHYWARTQDGQTDLKLGVGGIRDLELFTHALQVVHGGKDSRLHQADTTLALSSFSRHQILPNSDVQFLMDFYWQLRSLENIVQAQNDQQTHILKSDLVLPGHLISTKKNLSENMLRCDRVVSDLLGKVSLIPERLPESQTRQEDWLRSLGFEDSEINEVWPEVLAIPILSRNKQRDQEIRNRFLFQFIELLAKVAKAGPPKNGLALTRDFLLSMKAKSSFYSMLLSHPSLMDMLVQLFAHSPYLSKMICSRPELIDSLVIRTVDDDSANGQATEDFLNGLAERRMLAEVVSGAEFLKGESLDVIQKNLTETADAICVRLLNQVALEVGAPAPHLLALGKWGGQELGFRSDLDCIFVSSSAPTEADHKIIRRFINRLTESHRGGSLYSIDTRLKMTGAGGVILTTHEDLNRYLANNAESWERQAYLRGRWIGTPSRQSPHAHCISRALTTTDLVQLEKIRVSLTENANGHLDLKYSEGGLIDLEFAVQISIMKFQIQTEETSTRRMLELLAKTDPLWNANATELLSNYDLMRLAEQYQKLLSHENLTSLSANQSYLHPMANRLNLTAEALNTELACAFSAQLEILKKLDPRRTQSY